MNTFYDTHCNIPNVLDKLKLNDYDDLTNHVNNTISSHPQHPSFKGCISVASDIESHQSTKDLEDFVHTVFEKDYHSLTNLIKSKRCVALGEIGLDYHEFPGMNFANKETQLDSFIKQMDIAKINQKSIVLHTREAEDDTMKLMKEHIDKYTFIDVHCYTGSVEFAKWLMKEYPNAYIGIVSVVTFKNSKDIRNVVKNIPLDKLLVETDAPCMAPVLFRGKPCHPSHIPWIIDSIAKVKEVSVEKVYEETTKNAESMFAIQAH
ncbi:Hydrolase TatD family protein [Entamoeba marina]